MNEQPSTYTPPDESRCTATTKRGTRCRHVAVSWRTDAGEDPRVCGGHMSPEQRAAIKEAERRERATWFRALPEKQQTAILRRAEIFRSGVPACWTWPASVPTEDDYRRMQRARLKEEGYSDEVLEKLWEFERTVPFDDAAALWLWQNGRCAVCEDVGLELVTDHDHVSGLVRGLLCRSCNTLEAANGGEDNVFGRYRNRPPTQILGIEMRYWDPFAREFAPDRRNEEPRDPWENAILF